MIVAAGILLYLFIGFVFALLYTISEGSETTVSDVLDSEFLVFTILWPLCTVVWICLEANQKYGKVVLFRKKPKK
jgi:hypothetical protein